MSLAIVRNIGIIAHIDAGKTTVSERILFYSGKEHKMGEVHYGSAKMDYLEEEQQRGITITAAATTFLWAGHKVNLIDTPGHVDFTAEVERSLRVLDGAIVVFDGVAGVEAQSETVWHQADRYHVPRLIFINKQDRIGADPERVRRMIADRLTPNAVPLQIPIGVEDSFEGVVDLVSREALRFDEGSFGKDIVRGPVPENLRDEVEEARAFLVERAAEQDEALTDKYLNGGDLSPEEIRRGIRTGTLAHRVTPLLYGAALRNKGIQPLLDAVVAYLPSPLDVGSVHGRNPKTGKAEERPPDPHAPLCALAFKTVGDRHGDLTFVRIYSGVIDGKVQIYNPRVDRVERANRICLMHADERLNIPRAEAGDIVALVGLRWTATGDTLCPKHEPIVLEAMEFPETVISMAIEPKTMADRDRLLECLDRMAKDDPTFATRQDEETGQIIISGMGELHLEVLEHQLLREYRIEAKVGKPRVAYRQTIGARADAEGVFDREMAGRRHFARVALSVYPIPSERRMQFSAGGVEGRATRLFVEAVHSGVKSACEGGVGFGYPVVQLGVSLTDMTVHDTDSSEAAFEAAANIAMREAFERSGAVLLEPIMRIEVSTPESFLGDVIGDLNARRAEIHDVEARGEVRVIKGLAPLARMFGYSSSLRSATQGRATYTMEPHSYAPAPPDVVERYSF